MQSVMICVGTSKVCKRKNRPPVCYQSTWTILRFPVIYGSTLFKRIPQAMV